MISVIVPVFNVEKYLDRCILSIVSQTYLDIEIILIDDGSTDSSSVICDTWEQKDNRIKVIHKKNEGVSIARNTGIDAAQGEYVYFVDGDDYLESNAFEKMYNIIKKYDVDFVYCGFNQIDSIDRKIYDETGKSNIRKKEEVLDEFFEQNITKTLMYPPWNKLCKAQIVKKIKFNNNYKIGEDVLFNFMLLDESKRVYFLNETLYNYIIRKNSAMRENFSSKKFDYVYAAYDIENICKDKYSQTLYEKAHFWTFCHNMVIVRNILLNNMQKKYFENYAYFVNYLKKNKKECYKKLSAKKRIEFIVILYFPWMITKLKKFF